MTHIQHQYRHEHTRSEVLDWRVRYDYHVNDLGEGDLQRDVDDVIRVLDGPQRICVV